MNQFSSPRKKKESIPEKARARKRIAQRALTHLFARNHKATTVDGGHPTVFVGDLDEVGAVSRGPLSRNYQRRTRVLSLPEEVLKRSCHGGQTRLENTVGMCTAAEQTRRRDEAPLRSIKCILLFFLLDLVAIFPLSRTKWIAVGGKCAAGHAPSRPLHNT